jgi:hypothetical protein
MACASSIIMHHMFYLRLDNGDKLGIENPIQISQTKKKRKKRRKGELNFVSGNSSNVSLHKFFFKMALNKILRKIV